jgi:DNA repair exonuclease SbcCD nuclease subunit
VAKNLFVAGSDNHVEYSVYVNRPDMWGDSYYAFEQEVDAAVSRKIPLVLAGDVFDKTHPDSLSIKKAMVQLDRLAAVGQTVYFIQGQHEMSRRQPWLGLHEAAVHVDGKAFRIGGVLCYGIDYQPASHLADAMASIPPFARVLVCHQVWEEFMGDVCAPEGSLTKLVPDHIDLVITGDLHSHRTELVVNKNGHPFRVLSPGSAVPQNIGEYADKYFFVVDRDGDILESTSVKLKGRKVVHSSLQGTSLTEFQMNKVNSEVNLAVEFSKDLPAHLAKPMVVLTTTVPRCNQYDTFVEKLKEKCFLFEKFPKVERGDRLDVASLAHSSFEAVLSKAVSADSADYGLALRLWKSEDSAVTTTVSEIVAELMETTAQPESLGDTP